MPASAARRRRAAMAASVWATGRQPWGPLAKIWIVSAPMARARSMHFSSAPAAETWAPIFIPSLRPPAPPGRLRPTKPTRLLAELGSEVGVSDGAQLIGELG